MYKPKLSTFHRSFSKNVYGVFLGAGVIGSFWGGPPHGLAPQRRHSLLLGAAFFIRRHQRRSQNLPEPRGSRSARPRRARVPCLTTMCKTLAPWVSRVRLERIFSPERRIWFLELALAIATLPARRRQRFRTRPYDSSISMFASSMPSSMPPFR